jgi:hypothetical protein
MNQAHIVPPAAVPYTSAANAPDGDAGWQPAAPRGAGVRTVVVLGEMLALLGAEGAHASNIANPNAVAMAHRNIC